MWKTESYSHLNLPEKQEGCILTLFHTELITPSLSLVIWNVKHEVKVPTKYYSNGYDLCAYLNKGDKSQFDYEFGYNVQSNEFNIVARGKTVVKISKQLVTTLGFTRHGFYGKIVVGTLSLLNMNIQHLYISAKFIQTTVGGAPVPLLRYSLINNKLFGQTM